MDDKAGNDNIEVTDTEIMEIEKEILLATEEESANKAKPKASKPRSGTTTVKQDVESKAQVENFVPRTVTKKKIAADITRICEELGEPVPSAHYFDKTKKAQLIEDLKALMGKAAQKVMDEKAKEMQQKALYENPEKNVTVKSLYNANLLVCGILERVTGAMQERTWDINMLDGFMEETSKNRESLMLVFAEIVEEYGAEIQKYVSPINKYAMIMLISAGNTVHNNVAKKKANLNSESKDK